MRLALLRLTLCALMVATSLGPATPQTTPRGDTDRWFGGYQCLRDCVRHRRGYEWALTRGINSLEECPEFEDKSFVLGCRVYIANPYRDPNFDDDNKLIRRR